MFVDFPQVHTVTRFVASEPDELDLEEADVVSVYQKSPDGLYHCAVYWASLLVPYTHYSGLWLPIRDLFTCVNQLCVKQWQHLWSQCTSNKLYCVQAVIGHNRNLSPSHYNLVLINRLRIGHTRLTNLCLLNGENQPECQICHSPLTVKHILIDCTCFGAARQKYLGFDKLKELFENVQSRNMVAFIKDTYFYHCIQHFFILA